MADEEVIVTGIWYIEEKHLELNCVCLVQTTGFRVIGFKRIDCLQFTGISKRRERPEKTWIEQLELWRLI